MPLTASWVWEHFNKNEDSNDAATCIICNRSYGCKKSSTTGLSRHLSSVHKITRALNEGNSDSFAAKSSANEFRKQNKKWRRDEKEQEENEAHDIEEDVAKMMAMDGFSANQIARSTFIRDAFSRKSTSYCYYNYIFFYLENKYNIYIYIYIYEEKY